MSIDTILEISELRAIIASWRKAGELVAFVPTMGALHDGHLSLVKQAKNKGSKVVVSIFVNPLQFGPNEDFARYPRTLKDDVEKLKSVDADVAFAPSATEIYPIGFQTSVVNSELSQLLCGRFRPGHFNGMLTVVLKLLNIVRADEVYFGKKDYQQWRLIERMVIDFAMPMTIVGCDTVREHDGLAMSSRNRYLSSEEREQASLIYRGLTTVKEAFHSGERDYDQLLAKFSQVISISPQMVIQYAEIVNKHTLKQGVKDGSDFDLVMIVAIMFGDVRLIDNLEF